jgi:hypothetical protein
MTRSERFSNRPKLLDVTNMTPSVRRFHATDRRP